MSSTVFRPATLLSIAAALYAAGGPLRAQTPAAPVPQPVPGTVTPAAEATAPAGARALRICGDPDNMPFSNAREQGFENKIAALVARELGERLEYLWWPHRRGFVRNTLRNKECDLIIGVPRGFDPVAGTKPYYRSTYYIVSRADRGLRIKSLDDPALRKLRVGVNIIGNDYENTPPAHALGRRGITAVGFNTFYGPGSDSRPEDIVNAVVNRVVDVAVVWGPLAGYFAKQAAVPLTLVALPDSDATRFSGQPFAYDIVMGVRRADRGFRAQLDSLLDRKRPEIQKILQAYNVPVLPPSPDRAASAAPKGDR